MVKNAINIGDFIQIDEPPLTPNTKEIDVSFKASDGSIIHGVLCCPINQPITQKALFLHEIEGQAKGGPTEVISRRYAKLGIATLSIDFRGHGKRKSEWEDYHPQSMFSDAVDSINWLDANYPEIDKTMLGGFSTGGGIAVILREFDERVSKTCLLYPVLSFKNNFLAAAYGDEKLMFPIKLWDDVTPWRKLDFTREKIESSLKKDTPFSLTAHTYGANFIKGCKDYADKGDIEQSLWSERSSPLTIVQGTRDLCVPHVLAKVYHQWAREIGKPVRLVSMEGMGHYVPPVWKNSVINQFVKAAIQPAEDFNPRRTIVKLRPTEKGYVDLNALLQEHKDRGLVQQIG